MQTNKEDMGKRIRDIRERLGLGQDEVGRLTGTSKQSISSYETGRSFPPLDFLAAISDMSGISIDQIVTGRGWGQAEKGGAKPKGEIAASIEPGEPDARDRLIKQRATALAGGGADHSKAKEGHVAPVSEDDKINIHEGLLMTTRVLQSETGYAQALWSNLKSFDEAVGKEEKVKDLERKMDLMLEKMSKMEERLAATAASPEKRDKAAGA